MQGLEACCAALDLASVHEETLLVSSRARAGALHALAAWTQSVSTLASSSSSSLPATTSAMLVVLLPVILAACGDVTKIVRQGATTLAKTLSEISSRTSLTLGKGLEKGRKADGNHNAALETITMAEVISFGRVVSNAGHAIVDDRWVASMTVGNAIFRPSGSTGQGKASEGKDNASTLGLALRRLAVLFGWSAPHIAVAVVEAGASSASLFVSWTQLLKPLLLQSSSYHCGDDETNDSNTGTKRVDSVERGVLSMDAERLVGALVRGLSTIQLADADVQKEVVAWVCQCVTGSVPSSSSSSSSTSSSHSRASARGHRHNAVALNHGSSNDGQDNSLTEALCDEILRLLAQDWTANLGTPNPSPLLDTHIVLFYATYLFIPDTYSDTINTRPARSCYARTSI